MSFSVSYFKALHLVDVKNQFTSQFLESINDVEVDMTVLHLIKFITCYLLGFCVYLV